jgi:peptidoglycan/xylan/chitin deacetylase (PgdA/CDA1 family)
VKVLGCVAREMPCLVRAIAAEGHEIGLHGNMHRRIDHMTREEFEGDLDANIKAVADASRRIPDGFRAPCFSISSKAASLTSLR